MSFFGIDAVIRMLLAAFFVFVAGSKIGMGYSERFFLAKPVFWGVVVLELLLAIVLLSSQHGLSALWAVVLFCVGALVVTYGAGQRECGCLTMFHISPSGKVAIILGLAALALLGLHVRARTQAEGNFGPG